MTFELSFELFKLQRFNAH